MTSRGFTQINADKQSDRPQIYTDMIAPVHRILSLKSAFICG